MRPSIDSWLSEAKKDLNSGKVGMYLVHNGVVRETAKAKVRLGDETATDVKGMFFSFDREKAEGFANETRKMEGIFYVRYWMNEGNLEVGDDIMQVLIGGDIRPHVIDALNYLVGHLKDECVTEIEKH